MLSEEKILESFVKSIAKTTGVITVLSVLGGVLYMTTDIFKQKEIYKSFDTKTTVNNEDNEKNVKDKYKNLEHELNDDISMSFLEDTNDYEETTKYKEVLDQICYK